jgi:hypothetical protein
MIVIVPSAGSTSCDAMINSPPTCISRWTISGQLVQARPSAGKRHDGASRVLGSVGIKDAVRKEERKIWLGEGRKLKANRVVVAIRTWQLRPARSTVRLLSS